MKIKETKTKVILIFAAAAAALLTGGYAEMGSGNTTSLLSAAGFRVRTPQTPQQQQIYPALPSYQVHRATVKGKTFYVYKDEKAGGGLHRPGTGIPALSRVGGSAADCPKLLHGSGNGPCSRIWLVRSMGPAGVMVVNGRG